MDCLRMKIPLSTGIPEAKIGETISCVLVIPNVRRATAYLSERFTVKATAQRRIGKNAKSSTVLVTMGSPNFVERRFIRSCKKDGMCFPLSQIQLKFWPKKKPAKRKHRPKMTVTATLDGKPLGVRWTQTQ